MISIHALLAESDRLAPRSRDNSMDFYPRSPCGERQGTTSSINVRINFYPRSPCGERLSPILKGFTGGLFLSTLSLRRATRSKQPSSGLNIHFYPRSPCGERLACVRRFKIIYRDFYPRSPCGERPALSQSSAKSTPISIHALLAESDAAGRILLS